MHKNVFSILVMILLSTQSFSQKDIHIKSQLMKTVAFKDTTSNDSRELYYKCLEWKLSPEDVYKIFSICKRISSEEKAGLYNWLPCYFKCRVLYKGYMYTMEVNAASFIVLYNKKSTLYFGCSSADCKNFFILSGGNASSD